VLCSTSVRDNGMYRRFTCSV